MMNNENNALAIAAAEAAELEKVLKRKGAEYKVASETSMMATNQEEAEWQTAQIICDNLDVQISLTATAKYNAEEQLAALDAELLEAEKKEYRIPEPGGAFPMNPEDVRKFTEVNKAVVDIFRKMHVVQKKMFKSEQKLRQARSRLAFYYEKLEKASVHSKKCFQLAKKRKEEKDDARKAYEEAVMKEMEASLEEENSTQNILYNAYLDA